MRRKFILGLLLFSLGAALPCEGGMFRNPGSSGHPWRFDGRGFVPGGGDGTPVILVRDGYLPVLRESDTSAPTVPLPDGTGVISGICYLQVAGGKLAAQNGIVPAEGCRVEIVGIDRLRRHATADRNGFFSLPLPAGSYEVHGAGSPLKLTVMAGKTALVALRTGKRMVD